MESRRIVIIAIIAAAAMSLFLTTTTFGGMLKPNHPVDSYAAGLHGVNHATLARNLLEFAGKRTGATNLPPSLAPPPRGDVATTNTSVPQDTWIYISANTTVWYRVGDDIRRLTIGVDANNEPGLRMSVYSPEQHDVRSTDPIGRGTNANGHDLWWSGIVRSKGPWYVRIDNHGDYSIPFKLMTRTATDDGVEYVPNVAYDFGTGDSMKIATQVAGSHTVVPAVQSVTASIAPAPAPALPGSSDPYNAPAPSGQEVYIQPHTTVWYSASDGFRRLTMYIDANHQTGLSMSIYGPDQQDVWHEKPAGKPGPGEGHDFFWTGRSAFKGSWRIKLTNNNDFAVPYTFTAMSVSDRNGDLCRNCHGNIQDEWDRCEHSGSFCDDLKDQYKN